MRARTSQADRRARSRGALLEAAARGISRHGYANLVLARVAEEAGYTRGALYHQFPDKAALALAVVDWVEETWTAEVGRPAADEPDPVRALVQVARGHAVYCRRDIARVMRTLQVEFAGQDHPVGAAVSIVFAGLVADTAARIDQGRATGAIPPGPPTEAVATAYIGALEGVVSLVAGQEPHDVVLAERAVRGVLGI